MQNTETASAVLQIFAKYPVAGQVKTRLHSVLTPEEASRFHASLVLECVEKFTSLPASFEVELWGDRPAAEPFYRSMLEAFPALGFRLQEGGDLGQRMAAAFRSGLARYKKVILIGTDCPALGLQYILEMESALKESSLNLIAAEDGGYVAIGSCSYHDTFFDDKDWGTETVLRQTLDAAERLGWQSVIHGCLWDVDDAADYRRYLLTFQPDLQRGEDEWH
ncbi:MAG: TIGR04282 family arsenosugar biosynthesis glycosyltransferase [Gammaproteobacteria bacterium]|nr:TIGR04282 family arsenosugar biosynthesis glycosyltransferase [Gammaproteobacteria bacterium]